MADVATIWGENPRRPDRGPELDPYVAALQPTEAERNMGPRVVASNGDEVVVLWRQRGLSPGGERFDGPVLGLYTIHDGKLARAQMFYFDTLALVEFLARAGSRAA